MRVRGAVPAEIGALAPGAESRPLEVAELELGGPGPEELLVRVGAARLCRCDLSVIDGSRPRVISMVLGHEAAGEDVGSGVRGAVTEAPLHHHLGEIGAPRGPRARAPAGARGDQRVVRPPRRRRGRAAGRRFLVL